MTVFKILELLSWSLFCQCYQMKNKLPQNMQMYTVASFLKIRQLRNTIKLKLMPSNHDKIVLVEVIDEIFFFFNSKNSVQWLICAYIMFKGFWFLFFANEHGWFSLVMFEKKQRSHCWIQVQNKVSFYASWYKNRCIYG